jgi:alkanesulfonate monooxygenase SsuD/methylene tetrahydromethanopterin reductase-like flavin-dependent oxidoreductase (luciferase family)
LIGAGFPICVTDDPDAARAAAGKTFAIYGTLPSYQAMLAREGAEGPSDVAIVGDEAAVSAQLEHLRTIGVTDFVASVFGSADDRARTYAYLAAIL